MQNHGNYNYNNNNDYSHMNGHHANGYHAHANGYPANGDNGTNTNSQQLAGGIQAHLSPPNQLPRVADDQLKSLESNFLHNRNPSDLDITIIAAEVGLPEPAVKRWFQHRLARWRQQQGLPANSGSVTE